MVKLYSPACGVLPFGKMGNGKSTLGNCLLGTKNAFKEGSGACGVTQVIVRKTLNGLTFWDVPGLGDPMTDDEEFAKAFIKTFTKDLKAGALLNAVIVVKKSNDFRVDTDMALYTLVLAAIMNAEPNFDFSKLILGLTFCEHFTVTDAQIEEFWKILFKCSGIGSKYSPPPASRTIRHRLSSTQEDMHRQLAPLLGGLKKVKQVRAVDYSLLCMTDSFAAKASPGVQKAYAKAKEGCCFRVGQSVVRKGESEGRAETVRIEDIQVGDQVLCYDPATRKQFYDSVIYTNDHSMFREGRIVVTTFSLQSNDGQVHKLALTPNHNAIVLDHRTGLVLPKVARDVVVGDTMLIFVDSGEVQDAKVLEREDTSVLTQQVFAIHTLSSHIVVNGVVASCYSEELGWKYKQALKFFGRLCPHAMTAVARRGEAYLNRTGQASEHNWLAIAVSQSSGLILLLTLLALANSPSAIWVILFCGLLARGCTLNAYKSYFSALQN